MQQISHSKKQLLLFLSLMVAINMAYSQPLYWINGPGNWTDVNHWSKDPGNMGSGSAGVIPSSNNDAVFDDFSGLTNTSVINIPNGNYEVESIVVTTSTAFTLLFGGVSGSPVVLTIFADIDLTPAMNLNYSSTNPLHNIWKFDGPDEHDISTGNNDLQNIELLNINGTFNQLSDLSASTQIRIYAGTWNSNGFDINAGKILFRDNQPSNAPLTKVFNTDNSNIYCEEWDSGLTYGSLTVAGSHNIYTPKFRGSSKQLGGPAFFFDDIFLLEYSDTPSGGAPIEYNNFECRECIIDDLTIEDTGDTKIADRVTITGKLTVVNSGSRILFNAANSRTSDITLNGIVITPPAESCGNRTIFSSVHTDEVTFIRSSGSLNISDAIINNVQTSGGASFSVSNGILQGSSTGWNINTAPASLTYVWKGLTGANANWNNPTSWALQSGGSNGCIPSLADDVIIDNSAKGDIRVPAPFAAKCRHFIWTNTKGRELKLDGSTNLESSLTVTGDFFLDPSATITSVNNHEIYFSSASNNEITTNGVTLPELWFSGDIGEWRLADDLTCDRLTFKGGTLRTQNQDIVTNYWNSIDDNPKHFLFGASHITVNGEMALSRSFSANVTVTPGTSLIECEDLTSSVTNLYNVKLINSSSRLLENYPYDFNSLILGGTGQVSTQNDLTLNDLVFALNGSTLALDLGSDFNLNGGIESLTTTANPGTLKSRTNGVRAAVNKAVGNICAIGSIAFQDIDASISGVFNAPDGVDNGNNTGINFDDGAASTTLYWIAGSGLWHLPANWSRVSGGCPDNRNPNNATNLIFNNNSFFDNYEVITVAGNNTCNEMYFYNSQSSVTLDIDFTLAPSRIVVANGDLTMTGTNLLVDGETRIESGGYFSIDLLNFVTKSLNTTSGLFVLRAGSNATVQP